MPVYIDEPAFSVWISRSVTDIDSPDNCHAVGYSIDYESDQAFATIVIPLVSCVCILILLDLDIHGNASSARCRDGRSVDRGVVPRIDSRDRRLCRVGDRSDSQRIGRIGLSCYRSKRTVGRRIGNPVLNIKGVSTVFVWRAFGVDTVYSRTGNFVPVSFKDHS